MEDTRALRGTGIPEDFKFPDGHTEDSRQKSPKFRSSTFSNCVLQTNFLGAASAG